MALTVASTTAVVAGIPALIGFVPHESLVLLTALAHGNGSVTTGPLMRVDLTHVMQDAEDCVGRFATQVADLPVECVTGIIVRNLTDDTVDDEEPLREHVDAVVALLAGHGFTDLDIVHVPVIATGSRWRSYLDPGRTGILPDPATTAIAVAAAVAGRPVAARREDLAALYTPAAEHIRARLQHQIADALTDAGVDAHLPAAARDRLARAGAAIRAASEGTLRADDAAIADLVATFVTPPFRDALLTADSTELHFGAENLALLLWRHSGEPVASHLAAVIAVHAYQRGDGVSARIALETADLEQPLPQLLLTALDHAVPPSEIRKLAQQICRECRHTLGSPVTDQS